VADCWMTASETCSDGASSTDCCPLAAVSRIASATKSTVSATVDFVATGRIDLMICCYSGCEITRYVTRHCLSSFSAKFLHVNDTMLFVHAYSVTLGVCRVARLLTRPAGRFGSGQKIENLQERAGRVASGPVQPEAKI